MPTVRVGELEMYYEATGIGRPLVMIMGLGANAGWWGSGVIQALSRDFRVIVFDNRDAGRTRGPARLYSIRDMAEDTVGLMDALGLEKACVLGLSMGGMIAQELALGHPERVERLVLGCTTPGLKRGVPPAPGVMRLLAVESRGPGLRQAFALARATLATSWLLTHLYALPRLWRMALFHPTSPEGYLRQLQAIAEFDASDRLPALRVPTLVLHGTLDVLLPPENGRLLAELIPGARLVLFKGAAHGLNLERPWQFVRAVREFLLDAGSQPTLPGQATPAG
ncbi:MAG: alpha/beta hydrolase [Firmicutes bacterium]|nr:alpha/beta hydrolase [Bacillota bacterium]